jgi:hypothetical protein
MFAKSILAGGALLALTAAPAFSATVSGSFTDLQSESVSWTATVDAGITLLQQICCTLPGDQGDGTIKDLINTAFGKSYTANVGKQDGFPDGTFGANWTGSSAEAFAIHIGGKGGGNELLILLSGNTDIFDFSYSGAKGGLSSLQGFAGLDRGEGDPPSANPLPAALPMFLGGAGLIALLARRRNQKRAA